MVVRLVHTGLGSQYLIARVLHYPPPPTRTSLYRHCSNKHHRTTSRFRVAAVPGRHGAEEEAELEEEEGEGYESGAARP